MTQRVLLVCDDAAALASLKAMLDPLGVPVVLAESAAEAALRATNEDFSLVVLDMHVFELDGLETAALLKRVDRTHAVPIVVLSPLDPGAATAAPWDASGAASFVQKPVAPEELRAKVRACLALPADPRPSRSDSLLPPEFSSGRLSERLMAASRAVDDPTETVEALVRIHTALSEGLDLGRIAQRLIDETTALTAASGGAFYYLARLARADVLRQGGEVLSASSMDVAFAGAMQSELSQLGPTCPLLERVFRGIAPLRVGSRAREGHDATLPTNVRSILAMPVLSRRGDVAGAMVWIHEEVDAFDARDEELAAVAARDAAASFENARLYEEAKEARHRAEVAELELRAGEARRRIALEAAGLGTWDYHPTTTALRWDARARALSGFDPEAEVTYASWMAAIHRDDRAEVDRAVRMALDPTTTGKLDCEYRMVGSEDGALRWIAANAQGIVEQGRTVRVIGTFLDVTAKRRTDEERSALLAREKHARAQAERAQADAESANRAKDEFLATVSHELRNPLNAILGWSRILLEGRDDPVSERMRRGIEIIARNARAQVRLVEDILDVSRIVSGKLRLTTAAVDVRAIVDACVDTVRPAAHAKGVRLEVTIADEPGTVIADEDRLRQILWNLTSNAVKFTPRDGRVRIVAARDDEAVRFEVSDTGVGISQAFLPFVFDRFSQADGSSTRSYGGLGLGLAIVRHLAELHGGTVAAESAGLGHGATFRVRQPRHPVAHCASDGEADFVQSGPELAQSARPVQLRDRHVLAVAVDEEMGALLALAFEHAGATIACVPDVEVALKRLSSTRPDVVLADLSMPDEALRRLVRGVRDAADAYVRPACIVALSGTGVDPARTRSIAKDVDLHVERPIDPTSLVTKLARLTGTGDGDAHAPSGPREAVVDARASAS